MYIIQDLNAVIWLEDYLATRFKGTLLVVSHDQDFLGSVVTDIVHLENKKLTQYRGDVYAFRLMHAQRKEKQEKVCIHTYTQYNNGCFFLTALFFFVFSLLFQEYRKQVKTAKGKAIKVYKFLCCVSGFFFKK